MKTKNSSLRTKSVVTQIMYRILTIIDKLRSHSDG